MSNKEEGFKVYVYGCAFIFVLLCFMALSYERENRKDTEVYVRENLITPAEKILLAQLFEMSGYIVQRTGNYENKFEEKVYRKIKYIRNSKPINLNYVFCNNNEFLEVSKLFKNNINGNKIIDKLGLERINEFRVSCSSK
jgi:hypothetical protein